ncbi:Retrovirus-related Pol polyprotein from type-2 retrotransposable element R2DM [Halotydeus destructor]|nr:Retrovirus-related Pol polyprotein from type-2 retrotransposable element R2DM [Halotydeus destructor]
MVHHIKSHPQVLAPARLVVPGAGSSLTPNLNLVPTVVCNQGNGSHGNAAPPALRDAPAARGRRRPPVIASIREPNKNQKEWLKLLANKDITSVENVLNLMKEAYKTSTRPRRLDASPPRRQQLGAKKVQANYRKNRKRTMRAIFNTPDHRPLFSDRVIFEHYKEAFSGGITNSSSDGLMAVLPRASRRLEPTPFTAQVTWARMKMVSNTAPGPDDVSFALLRRMDPGGLVMASICNICLEKCKVPAQWLSSITQLLYKKQDPGDLTNWRPISLQASSYKIFIGLVAGMLSQWAEENSLLSSCQKGFRSMDGCAEHNYTISSCILHAKENRKTVHMAFIDLSSAFTSIDHSYLFSCLETMGVPSSLLNLLRSIYGSYETRVIGRRRLTEPIKADRYRYLGVDVGILRPPSPLSLFDELVADSKKVTESLLAPWQKIDAYRTFVLPKALFMLRECFFTREALTEVEKHITANVRSWCHLPRQSAKNFQYIQQHKGGAGLVPVPLDYYILKVALALKLLSSHDADLKNAAWAHLKARAGAGSGQPLSVDDTLKWLNEGDQFRKSEDFFENVRFATKILRNHMHIRWSYCETRSELELEVKTAAMRTIVPHTARSQLTKVLRSAGFSHSRPSQPRPGLPRPSLVGPRQPYSKQPEQQLPKCPQPIQSMSKPQTLS